MDALHAILNKTPLFQGLGDDDRSAISRIAATRSVNKGDRIFSEGDPGNGFYVVITGQVKVFKVSAEGKEQILHIFESGEPFGEVPVFTGTPFPAHAEAIAPAQLAFFPKAEFIDLIGRQPSMAMAMLGILSQRLRQFARQVENLSLKEVPGRLAAYVLFVSHDQADTDTIELPISKKHLANLLGTIPETLSRIFSKMSGEGLIQVDQRRIHILDRAGLEMVSEQGKV